MTPRPADTIDPPPLGAQPLHFVLRSVIVAFAVLAYFAYVGVGLTLGISVISHAVQLPQVVTEEANLQIGSATISIPTISMGPVLSPLELFPSWQGTERINILLLGFDQREDEHEAGIATRSDTLIVVSIDPVSETAAMISFPRDLWVAIPGIGPNKINSAFRTGELRGIDGGGAGMAAATIEQNFGLHTSYFAAVDFDGFQGIVDTLDGIVVDVPRPIKDDEYPTEDYGVERIYFSPGPQIMDGATALKYARTRHSIGDDFSRMRRQQQVLMAIVDRVLRLDMLARTPSLVEQGTHTVATNFTPGELLSLAKLAAKIDYSELRSLVIDNQLVTQTFSSDGQAILLPKREEIEREIQDVLADPRAVHEAPSEDRMAARD
ncbi:MAG: cell envelope-related transcriptional attenuator [Chloroflexi bacterium]|nr:cell envelope-related transcriptional attenuator [Chloroflexota bacterium]